MSKPLYGIFGCGAFGREGIALARQSCSALHPDGAFDLCFIDQAAKVPDVDGYPVLSLEQFASTPGRDLFYNVLIADVHTLRITAIADSEYG